MPYDNAEYLSPSVQIMLGADRLLNTEKNWIKGTFFDDEKTTFCVVGAIVTSARNLGFQVTEADMCEEYFAAYHSVEHTLKARGHPGHLSWFNDAPETTFSDIKALLQEAIELESAKVAV